MANKTIGPEMTIRPKLILALYLLMAAIHFGIGVRYCFAEQFMPYHAQAVGAPWEELDAGIQTLVLALMTVAGAGWLCLGFLTVVLALTAYKTGSVVARWVLPIATIILYLGSFAATWEVYRQTGASTPWGLSLLMLGMAIIALASDMPWLSRVRTD